VASISIQPRPWLLLRLLLLMLVVMVVMVCRHAQSLAASLRCCALIAV